ncbi:hypothetical protein, partial [Bradyrhizobium sp. SBR1B]|uniref:hypothetical protein n=1 Tax=Bradyrhizobium sp. SBR1B TaxID=2663836 RepID=UPI001AEEF61E
RPLGISQNESVHSKLESQSSGNENPESKQTLGGNRQRWLTTGSCSAASKLGAPLDSELALRTTRFSE